MGVRVPSFAPANMGWSGMQTSIETLSPLERRLNVDVPAEQIDREVEHRRKQRSTWETAARNSRASDRLTVDFTGRIGGAEFAGGSGSDVQFVLGERQMLPEFDAALSGAAAGERKTFPLTFPADYAGREVAGKTAEFEVTV